MKNRQIILSVLLLLIFDCQIARSQGTWTQKNDFGGTARIDAVGFSIDTKGYILTGFDYDSIRSDFWEWDQVTNTWTQKAAFEGTSRRGAVGFSIGNKGYIGTGEDMDSLRSDFWEWDQTTDTWSQKANFGGNARAYAVGFSIKQKGYIGTGEDGVSTQGNTMDFWEYDQATDTWTKKSDFGGWRRRFATGFSIGNKGYIVLGGESNIGFYYSDLWEWDQTTDTWTQKASFPSTNSGRVRPTSFVIENIAYVGTGYYLCGTECTVICNDLYGWDQSTDTWHQKAELTRGTYGSVGFSIGEKGYIGTGRYYPVRRDFWEYCPTCIETGNSELYNSLDISILPNPLSTQTVLLSNKILENATLLLYNSSGQRQLMITNIYGQTITINRKHLSSGMYYLQLIQDDKIIVMDKLIITDN